MKEKEEKDKKKKEEEEALTKLNSYPKCIIKKASEIIADDS